MTPANISSSTKQNLIVTLLFTFVVLLAYSNTFNSSFIFDDHTNIRLNHYVKIQDLSFSSLKRVATESTMRNRWLPNISFALNYYVHGMTTPGFHVFNTIIHILVGLALYKLLVTTLTLPFFKNKYHNYQLMALAATLIWLAHPLQTNAVTYIVQRMTSMAALFCLLSLLSYVRARLCNGTRTKQVSLFLLAALFAFCAFISKENAVMLPIMILAYEIFFLNSDDHVLLNTKNLYLTGIALAVLFVVIIVDFRGTNFIQSILNGYNIRDFTLGERLLTQPRVICLYVMLFLLPLPTLMNLNHDIEISTNLFSPPQTLIALLFILVLVWAMCYFFKRNRFVSFALFWFLGNLVIESTVIALELAYEHRMYMPSMFILPAVFTYIPLAKEKNKTLFVKALLCFTALLVFLTWQRNNIWKNEESMWLDVISKSPNLARPYVNLAKAKTKQKKFDEAIQLLNKAIELDPDKGVAYLNLGIIYDMINQPQKSVPYLKTSLNKKGGDYAKAFHSLGIVYRKLGDCNNAVKAAGLALKKDPKMLEAYITYGICSGNQGNYDEAIAIFKMAQAKGLHNVDLFNNWGVSLERLGKNEEALEMFNKSLAIEPNHFESIYNKGVVYSKMGKLEDAKREIEKALEVKRNQ